jgi:hypothetical protein
VPPTQAHTPNRFFLPLLTKPPQRDPAFFSKAAFFFTKTLLLMKFAIVTAVWKRPEVFEYFAEGIKNLISSQPSHEFRTFIAGSEGEQSKQMVEKHGFDYVEIPNNPLAKKHNTAVRLAKSWQPDYVLCLGSDDILSPSAFLSYLKIISTDRTVDIIGTTDLYFYDLMSERAVYWGGYDDDRKGDMAGAGVMLSARLLDMWGWRPWDIHYNDILDNSIRDKIKRTIPCRVETFSLKQQNSISVDLKSDENMTPFELWPNTVFISPSEVLNEFPYLQ